MSLSTRLSSLVRNLFHRKGIEKELDEQLTDYFEMLVGEKTRNGMSREEACRSALIEIGGREQVKEEVRDVWIGSLFDALGKDLGYAARVLSKKPSFTVFALLTLAVGIGANSAIFSVVDAVLLKPLPYRQPDRLVMVWSAFQDAGVLRAPASGPELEEMRSRSRLFQDFAGIWVSNGAVTGKGEPEEIKLGYVTANFFSVLGVSPQLGRDFLTSEEGTGAPHAILLSYGFWQSAYGSDPRMAGRSVQLEGQTYTVVGIMPRNLQIIFPSDSSVPPDIQAWVPFPYTLAAAPRELGFLRTVGRLRNGITIPSAQAELNGIAEQLRSQFKEFSQQKLGLQVVPLQADAVNEARPALLALSAAVGLVLLIACANVASLLLSRANERKKEITLRSALGASRSRIVRQLLTESVLLSCLGGIAGISVAWAALSWLPAIWPNAAPRIQDVRLNFLGLGFTLTISIVTGLIFGLVPALGASKANPIAALNEGGRSMAASKPLFRNLLILSEVTLGVVLLIGAGLMVRTMSRLMLVDPGFRPNRILTFQIALPRVRYPKDQDRANFVQQIEKNLSALPGVQAVGETSHLPFDDFPNWYSYYSPEGATAEKQNTTMADYRAISPGFLRTMGVSEVAGRDFSDLDSITRHRVAIVDETVAQETWPNRNPIGQRLNIECYMNGGFVQDRAEVVGVVKHVSFQSLMKQVRGQIYLPYAQSPRPWLAFTVRTAAPPQTLVDPIRLAVAQMDKDLPASKFRTMDEYVAQARTKTRFVTSLAGALGGIALLLACIGIYGVTAYSVTQKRSEIGIRMALGAQPSAILRQVLRQTMIFVVPGIAAGVVLSLMLAPLLSSLLFEVGALDPTTFLTVSVFLFVVALVACYIPARRATAIAPLVALRHE